MAHQLPILNEQTAEFFRNLGWVEGRDFLVTPDLPLDNEEEA